MEEVSLGQNPPSAERKILNFSSNKQDVDWLNQCFVGRTVESVDPRDVPSSLKVACLMTFSANLLGGNLLLLVPSKGENFEES
ncbi:unnamed protein product [Lupinus luteus]|uniref:Uncharacterized protein n=1 Tax=Lupinus luteus TaxID=3873 RepID=A0AAV1YA09_LUPLU